jgi:hypothetical protein
MKLPEIDSYEESLPEDCSPFEIAQLHCLRSIAVNLELLVAMQVALLKRDYPPEIETKTNEMLGDVIRLAQTNSVTGE